MIFRKLICLAAALVMSVSLFCACSGSNDLQSRLDDLQRKIEQQDDRIAELEDENKTLKDKVSGLEDELDKFKGGLSAESATEEFSLKITVDKNTAEIGENIKVSVEFINLSGQSLPIVFWANEGSSIHGIFDIHFYSFGSDPNWSTPFATKFKDVLEKDAKLLYTTHYYKIEESKTYEVYAEAAFYVGEESSKENRVNFRTKAIKISVI